MKTQCESNSDEVRKDEWNLCIAKRIKDPEQERDEWNLCIAKRIKELHQERLDIRRKMKQSPEHISVYYDDQLCRKLEICFLFRYLKNYENLSLEDISKLTGMSVRTIQQHINYIYGGI